ncbi:unnamed protein product [Diamesa hyperborea]
MDNKAGSKPVLKAASFLKPSKFTSVQGNGNSENGTNLFLAASNPFLKCEKDETAVASDDKTQKLAEQKDPVKEFLPQTKLGSLATNNVSSKLSEGSTGFVFGQNLHERVVRENVNDNEKNELKEESLLFSNTIATSKATPDKDKETSGDDPTSSTAASDEGIDEKKDEGTSDNISNNLSLVEAARKYEEQRGAQKRKYDEVETVTGEENETNILEINCKLFTFIDQNWEERGRGMLRLNDAKTTSHSRVVFRASGSLRVHLNTKVWKDQVCEQSSSKSLRLTALDKNGLIKIYLVMGRNEDISMLHKTLSYRVRMEQERSEASQDDDNTEENSFENSSEPNDEPATKKLTTSE